MSNAAAASGVIQVKPGIGDTLWHLPFIRTIAAVSPEGKVIFFAPPSTLARELLAAEPTVAEVAYFAHGGNEIARFLNVVRFARLLRKYNLQRIYILDRTTRPATAAWLAGIPERIGIGLGRQRLWITNPGIDRKYFHAHPIDWLRQLMASEGIPLNSTEPGLLIRPNVLAAIDAQFATLPRPWLALGIGGSHPSKDWPDGHWRTLMSKLDEVSGGTVFLVGGPALKARADQLIAQSRAEAINACDLPIIQCAALLQRADLFAGPDSGPLNLAASVGTEAYGLFGLTPPLNYSRYIHVVRAGDDPEMRTPLNEISPERLLSLLIPRLAELSR
jgi:heptosyltransferase-2